MLTSQIWKSWTWSNQGTESLSYLFLWQRPRLLVQPFWVTVRQLRRPLKKILFFFSAQACLSFRCNDVLLYVLFKIDWANCPTNFRYTWSKTRKHPGISMSDDFPVIFLWQWPRNARGHLDVKRSVFSLSMATHKGTVNRVCRWQRLLISMLLKDLHLEIYCI